MRASTHERTIQADADEPANPTGTDLPSLSPFVAVLLCEGSAQAAPTPKLLQPAHRGGVLSVCQTVFTSGRESANHSIRQSQHLRCVQTRATSVDAHSANRFAFLFLPQLRTWTSARERASAGSPRHEACPAKSDPLVGPSVLWARR